MPSGHLISIGFSSRIFNNVFDVDAEDASAVVSQQRGQWATNDFTPGGPKSAGEQENRQNKEAHRLMTVIVFPNARWPYLSTEL